jgi:hypothetical protein
VLVQEGQAESETQGKLTNESSNMQCKYKEIRLNLNATQETYKQNMSINRQGQYNDVMQNLKYNMRKE